MEGIDGLGHRVAGPRCRADRFHRQEQRERRDRWTSDEAERLARRSASWLPASSVWASRASWRCTHANVASAATSAADQRGDRRAAGCAAAPGARRRSCVAARPGEPAAPPSARPGWRRGTRVRAAGGPSSSSRTTPRSSPAALPAADSRPICRPPATRSSRRRGGDGCGDRRGRPRSTRAARTTP